MTSRGDHLAWCKRRALEILESGDAAGAFASMTSDLRKWEGGAMYSDDVMQVLWLAGTIELPSPVRMRRWIEGFN